MSETADRKRHYLRRLHEVLFSIYFSFLFVLFDESRLNAWSTIGRYLYFWHPHAISLGRSDIFLFYLELFLIPAVAVFVCLRVVSLFSFTRVLRYPVAGAIALAGFPLIALYRARSPLFFLGLTFAIAASCALLWMYGKWPVSAPLTIVLLILYYGLFTVLGLDPRANSAMQEAWFMCPVLGFAYTLVWAKYFTQIRGHASHDSSTKITMTASEP